MPRLVFPHSGRRRAALLLSATTLTILVACSDRTPAAGAASTASASASAAAAATPVAAYAEARAAATRSLENLKSYDLAADIVVDSRPVTAGGDTMHAELTFVAAARWPDRLLMTQAESETMLSLGTGPNGSWFHYAPMRAAYVGAPVTLTRDLADAARMELDEASIFNFYGGLGQLMLPEGREPAEMPVAETLTVGGREVPCKVFSLPAVVRAPGDQGPAPGASRWWLDPSTGICLKVIATTMLNGRAGEVEQTITYTINRFDVTAAPAEDRFAYQVPEGLRVSASLDQLANPESMTGQKAPDTVLTGLDGKTFKLSDLRGKVVFLDLWATWCGPCRQEMPHLETLHKELGDKVAFVAASNEDQATIEAFLQKTPYTMRIARISAEDAQNKFRATSIPTGFVIDKEGVIRAHMVGAQSEAQLRKALARAGVGG
jgi:thiol-disulfide isomerase/thioredoxin